MQEVVSARDISRPKSMSSFKKELASVLMNGPTGKVHGHSKLDLQATTETDAELYQDTSTLQIVDLPWTNGPVLTELMGPPTTAQSPVSSLKDCVYQSEDEKPQQILALGGSENGAPEQEDELRLPENPSSHVAFSMENLAKPKLKKAKSKDNPVESKHDARGPSDVISQLASHQVQIKRKDYRPGECVSSSDDDGDHTETEVQYSKLQAPAEQRKGFLSKFSFGRRKSVPERLAMDEQKDVESPSKIILEEPGETADFSEEKESSTNQKRGILAIGGHLRKSLFKRRSGRTGEKDREGPLQQIRPDDDIDTDSEDEEVLVFAPALQILDNSKPGVQPPPAVTEVTAEDAKAKMLPTERTVKKSSKKSPASQHGIDSDGSKWYFKSAEELSRVTSSSLTHISKTSLHSVPDEAYVEEEKSAGTDDGKANAKQDTRKAKKSVTSIFSKREEKAQDASIEAQQALEVLRQVEGLDKQETSLPEDDDGGLRQYFEEVLPSTSDETKKGNALAGAFHWLRRGGKKKSDPKPDVLVELVSVPRTSDVAVQFPEPEEQQTQKDLDSQQPLEIQDSDSQLRSASRSTAVSQELLWKVPEEQPTGQPSKAGQTSTELVFRCPSVQEEFPVVHASHPAGVDYVPGDSLLTLSSLDVNDQKLEVPPTTPAQYSGNLKPPKIPIFAACCPAPNKPIDLSVPYGPTKESSVSKHKAKGKCDKVEDSKANKDNKTSTKKDADAKRDPALANNGDDSSKQQKEMKKVKGPRETSASPGVAIVKTVAKHVVVKFREREQRKKRNRLTRGVDLVKTRKWRSCPSLLLKDVVSPKAKVSPTDGSLNVSGQQKVDGRFPESQRNRRASC